MAFDGIMINSIVKELRAALIGGRVSKIQQTDEYELYLTIKGNDNYKLLITADASLPLVYLTEENKTAPLTAPNFCMLLRKYIGNGKIVDIKQPNFERIVEIYIEHRNEMGDIEEKRLVTEIMGRHSNIILVDKDNRVLDSIKRIPSDVSSVREVLPGREYSYPPSNGKVDPLILEKNVFEKALSDKKTGVAKAIYTSINGFSPVIAEEICLRAEVDSRKTSTDIDDAEKNRLWESFCYVRGIIEQGEYKPCTYSDNGNPTEYAAFPLTLYEGYEKSGYDSPSKLIYSFYKAKAAKNRINTRSADLRHLLSNAVERSARKYDVQREQLADTEDREKFRIYGELINTYGYSAKKGDKELKCTNYYDNEEITIPLDEMLTPSENSVKYFAKYNKKKRTYDFLSGMIDETKAELDYLRSVQTELNLAETEEELADIRLELVQTGYAKAGGKMKKNGQSGSFGQGAGKKKGQKGMVQRSKPLHFISSDGYDMYVGRNNMQNDELSFKFASGNDMWFHAKKMPGSHVIVKKKDENDIPDTTYEEAGKLAAYYSSGKDAPKVEIDYTEKKNLRKPPHANPGYVIYHTNYSMMAEPDISSIKQIIDSE